MRCKGTAYLRPELVRPTRIGTVQQLVGQQRLTATAIPCSEGEWYTRPERTVHTYTEV
jgi:hypothetical protein